MKCGWMVSTCEPETAQHLAKAQETLAKARVMLSSGLADEAGCEACEAYVRLRYQVFGRLWHRTGRCGSN
jgi:hypothetical protein